MTKLLWKPIPSWEGFYEISNTGKIRNLHRNIIKKTVINKWGYEKVQLSKDRFIKTLSVHRLVAIVFVPNPDNKPEVNHKDGDKLNNNSSNLQWCTRGENQKHAYDTGLKSKKLLGNAVLNEELVREIRHLCLHKTYTQKEIGGMYNISHSTVHKIHKNISWRWV